MKGPLESRHTSSERSTPGLQAIRACAANGCANGRPSVPSLRLRAPDVCSRIYPNVQPGTFNLRLDHSGRHSELDAIRASCGLSTHRCGEDVNAVGYTGRGHTVRTSSHSRRASATRALNTPLRTAS